MREHKREEAMQRNKVYYKGENKKKSRGPAKVIGIGRKTVIVKHEGSKDAHHMDRERGRKNS